MHVDNVTSIYIEQILVYAIFLEFWYRFNNYQISQVQRFVLIPSVNIQNFTFLYNLY